MTKKSIITSILSSMVISAPAESPFGEFVVGIWPEYDHPGVLVIHTGTVESEYLPLELEVLVPAGTDRVMAVGQSSSENDLQPVTLEARDGESWAEITVVRETFQLEYYFNPFSPGERREGEVEIGFNQPLEEFHVAVQHPLAAEGFELLNEDAETFRDEHGLTYSRLHMGTFLPGERKTVSFSYRNPQDQLSIVLLREILGDREGGTNPAPVSDTGGSLLRYRLPTYQPFAVLSVLSAIIGYLFWKTNRGQTVQKPEEPKTDFCSQCGTPVREDDRFCSNCGHKFT